MLCKRCKNELPDNARFCLACGALQPMICPACQAESRPGSRTCSGCGKKLPLSGDSAVKFYKRRKTPTEIAAMVLLVLGALLVLTAAVMFLMGTLSDVSEPETVEEQVTEVTGPMNEEEFTVVVEEPITKPGKNPEAEDKPEQTEEESEQPEDKPEQTEEEDPVTEEDPTEETPEEETPQTPEEEAEQTPEESKPSVSETQWFFPDSSERLLTDADVAGLSKAELQIARNEIYARHGRKFNNPDLQAWFNSCSWYKGTIAPGDFNEQLIFNETELANVYFLKEKENG